MEYRKILLEYLVGDFVVRDNKSFGVHMDEFIGRRDSVAYLVEGFKVFGELIKICRENGWLNDFIPSFYLHMKNSEKVERDPNRSLLGSRECLIRNLDKIRPPEICLFGKLSYPNISRKASAYDMHMYTLSNELLRKLFGFPNGVISESIYANYLRFRDECCLEDMPPSYRRCIDIKYNRNDARVVRHLKRLTLRDESALAFLREYEEKHGIQA
jgi:hypothetical protein